MSIKKEKMFVPVIDGSRKKSVTLINANKIPSLEKVLPCKEALQIHIQRERIKTQKDSNYKPNPLCVKVEREIFIEMILELRKKNRNVEIKCIPLVLQYPAIPICVIEPKD